MTLLTIAQDILNETKSSDIPASIIGNNTDSAKQILQALKLSIKELSRDYDWQELQEEATFTSVDGQEGYDLPGDFDRFIDDTFWNASRMRQVAGVMTPSEWRILKNSTISGGASFDYYRIRTNQVLLFPIPGPAINYIYEYISNLVVLSSIGAGQTTWLADTDIPAIDAHIVRLDATWRLLKIQGRSYAEEQLTSENAIAERISRNGGRRTIMHQPRDLYGKASYPQTIRP